MRRKHHFSQWTEIMNFPQTPESIEKIRRNLIFEELFHLQMIIGLKSLKNSMTRQVPLKIDSSLADKLEKSLPFSLTTDQKKAIGEIQSDISNGKVMRRLIQGEVGSGKTLVAFMAALIYTSGDLQTVLAAPTELLARQHYKNSVKLMEPLGITTALLTGQTPPAERKEVLLKLASGEILLCIGTHALFSEDVRYRDLKLVILDEQHRFGVNQRLALIEKGEAPDTLLMTATPIPRTLALTSYGDLDISTIQTMPQGRLPIRTHLARQTNEQKVFDFVRRELENGHQAYFVYPLIEKSEKLDLRDAEGMFRRLSDEIYPDFPSAVIHSRIPEEQKRERMEAFYRGDIRILVATSVVEVGVDVPNATTMVIEHAERFGLSALHQLRGRIGRSDLQSYVFLVYTSHLSEEGKRRLMIMKENADGFKIAEEDLILRGPGELAGFRQSGYMSFTIADLVRDKEILLESRNEVRTLLKEDPGLLKDDHSPLGRFYRESPPFDESLLVTG